jgi:hypothetical protein
VHALDDHVRGQSLQDITYQSDILTAIQYRHLAGTVLPFHQGVPHHVKQVNLDAIDRQLCQSAMGLQHHLPILTWQTEDCVNADLDATVAG